MKTTRNMILFFVILALVSGQISAQNFSATMVGANIVGGVSITENAPLNFGSIPVPQAPVNVILSTTNGRISNSPAGIHLIDQTPSSNNARFTIGGSGNATYAITLPVNGSVKLTNGTDFIDVVDFKAQPGSTGIDGTTGLLSAEGFDSFSVGATVKLDEDVQYGNYSGTFGISVNYN